MTDIEKILIFAEKVCRADLGYRETNMCSFQADQFSHRIQAALEEISPVIRKLLMEQQYEQRCG